ncbi:ABC transporter permease [Shouchella patagoniensis]|uniref:ABC transporter permease n=1 Tax=Shouchella patagoniensis TaxID=228576 RepID=UPI0009959393|nr:iron ABC transporter permease [Shouchella patagoniensis]
MNNLSSQAMPRLMRLAFIGIIIWLISSFLIIPNAQVLLSIIYQDGSFTFSAFEKLYRSDRAVQSLYNSFILAIALVITVNIVGVFLVLVSEYFDIKGSGILRLGYMTTLIYGGIILAAGYKFVYGNNGVVTNLIQQVFPSLSDNWFSGFFAVLFVMTFATTSNHMLFLTNAIRKIDYQTIEAAKNMSASTWTILYRIVLPSLKPTMFAITILLFLTGLSALSAPLIIGGQDFQTIAPMILTFAGSSTSRDIAALLAVILGLATILLLSVLLKIEKNGNYISVSKVKTKLQKQKIENPFVNGIVHLLAYLCFAIYTLPIFLIILFSFTDAQTITTGHFSFDKLTLENYLNLFTEPRAFRPYLISISYSLIAAFFVVAFIIAVVRLISTFKSIWSDIIEYSLHIPWMLPSTLIAVSLVVTFSTPRIFVGNQVLTGTMIILLVAYVIVLIPFTLRMLKAAFFSLDPSLEEAAKNLGAGSMYTFFKIVLPSILPFASAIFALNFITNLSDYDLTVFLYHPIFEPLGIVIKNSTDPSAHPEARAMTYVYTVVLMIISGLALYLAYGRKNAKY